MGVYTRPSIVTNGLVLNLDAANIKSYPRSGTTWTDLSGNINTGTLTNGPTFSRDGGGSIVFDGTNDYVNIPSTSLFNFASNNFTIDVWCFYDASTSTDDIYRYLFNFQTATTNSYLTLTKWRSNAIPTNNSNGVNLDYSVAGSRYTITTNNIVPSPNVANTITSLYEVPNKWTNFTITVSSNVMSLYINSILYGSVTLTLRWNANAYLNIGTYDASVGSFMKGKIPNFKVYNKALSASEVLQNYNALKSRFNLT